MWERALASVASPTPRWLHGDLSPENLILRDGRLAGIIDFGCCAVGDPACDLVIAWTGFDRDRRERLRARLKADGEIWARGRGWALWKTLIQLAGLDSAPAPRAREVFQEILSD